ncbi:MAG: class I mannose-6-phosphate isomerase [Oscillospiraceae bacterium]|nr:class I mannose-6-phosphate isomerase [Oscillospiraceae bacterium]
MEILKLKPAVNKAIWGGRRLVEEYGLKTHKKNSAEGWMLSCHKDGPCKVTNGKYKGKTLEEALNAEGKEVLGTNNAERSDFPILIKFIDAKDKLSIQVHPADEYARRVENENGKTEAWLILDAEEDAQLVYGVKREVLKEEFSDSIENNTVEEILNYVKVKKGDVVFIPSGMLHAIGKGIFLAEVQQNSNTTYRVYDYDRRDKNGKPRELHIKKATDVANLSVAACDFSPKGKTEVLPNGAERTYLTGCEYFSMTEVKINSSYNGSADSSSFVSILILDGEGRLSSGKQRFSVKKGNSFFVPAGKGKFILEGNLSVLETRT